MTVEDNRTIVQHWFDLWNQHALDQLAELVSPEYCHHASSGKLLTFVQFKQGFQWILSAFPDLHYTIVHMIADRDMVAVYLSAVGTHQGNIFDIPPTGRSSQFTGVYHCRISDGKIVEDWDIFDILNVMFRLGATLKPD
jgi:steroid delta-isomerase-like uncharacterized protein